MPIVIGLLHVRSELDDWHPAIGRDIDSTNDIDMVLRDTVGPYNPPGIGPITIRHASLKEKKLDQ